MTSQEQAQELLEEYWVAKKILQECFSFPTQAKADEILSRVFEEMAACPTDTKRLSA